MYSIIPDSVSCTCYPAAYARRLDCFGPAVLLCRAIPAGDVVVPPALHTANVDTHDGGTFPDKCPTESALKNCFPLNGARLWLA